MSEPAVEIPDRAVFKAAEVCDLAHIPSYVLRSWEKEFPGLGIVPRPGGPRVYRRSDVEQILRIKHLVFAEGLTLAGARRKLEGDPPIEPEPDSLPLGLVTDDVRHRVATAKRELRSLLEMLGPTGDAAQAAATAADPPATTPDPPSQPINRPTSAWPPPPRPREKPQDLASTEDNPLPLLNGVPDTPAPKVRRIRRTGKAGDNPGAG